MYTTNTMSTFLFFPPEINIQSRMSKPFTGSVVLHIADNNLLQVLHIATYCKIKGKDTNIQLITRQDLQRLSQCCWVRMLF